jgi:hypothetical protein
MKFCACLHPVRNSAFLNSNPNGVWSYGYGDTLGSAFVLDDENVQDSSGLYLWRDFSQDPNGLSFAFNPTASPIIIDDTATGGQTIRSGIRINSR